MGYFITGEKTVFEISTALFVYLIRTQIEQK